MAWSKPESPRAQRQGRVHSWEGDLGERAGACSPTLREPAWAQRGLAHPAGPTLGRGRRVWGSDSTSMQEWRAGRREGRGSRCWEGEARSPWAQPRSGEKPWAWRSGSCSCCGRWDQEAATGAAGRGQGDGVGGPEALCPLRGVSSAQAASGAGKPGPSGPRQAVVFLGLVKWTVPHGV